MCLFLKLPSVSARPFSINPAYRIVICDFHANGREAIASLFSVEKKKLNTSAVSSTGEVVDTQLFASCFVNNISNTSAVSSYRVAIAR